MKSRAPFQTLKALMPLLLPSERVPCHDFHLELLTKPDWVDQAKQFHLAAAFFVSLRERNLLPNLPIQAKDRLAQAYQENAARQVILTALLARILDALQFLSEPPILLKGLAYAYELYPNPNTKVTSDIDLMIEPEEVDMVLEQLIHSGFKRIPHPPPRSCLRDKLLRNVGLESAYQRIIRNIKGSSRWGETWLTTVIGGREIVVDIHHIPFTVLSSIKEKIFHTDLGFDGRTRTLSLEVGNVRVMDYESAFLHAVRHLVLHHQLIGFRWHYDLALMLVLWRDHLKPERILEQARILGARKMVRVELAILEELFGPTLLHEEDKEGWLKDTLPVGYSICRRVAMGGGPTSLWKFIRPLLAPSFKEQLIVAFS
jgi:hypothetical protein